MHDADKQTPLPKRGRNETRTGGGCKQIDKAALSLFDHLMVTAKDAGGRCRFGWILNGLAEGALIFERQADPMRLLVRPSAAS